MAQHLAELSAKFLPRTVQFIFVFFKIHILYVAATVFYRITPHIIWTLLDNLYRNWPKLGFFNMNAEFFWDQLVFDDNSDIEMVV